MFSGIFPQLVVTILQTIDDNTRIIAEHLDWVFIVLLPNYSMGRGFESLYLNYDYVRLCLKSLPEDGFNMEPGKDSLDKICMQLSNTSRSLPCCKGRFTCWPCVRSIFYFTCSASKVGECVCCCFIVIVFAVVAHLVRFRAFAVK